METNRKRHVIGLMALAVALALSNSLAGARAGETSEAAAWLEWLQAQSPAQATTEPPRESTIQPNFCAPGTVRSTPTAPTAVNRDSMEQQMRELHRKIDELRRTVESLRQRLPAPETMPPMYPAPPRMPYYPWYPYYPPPLYPPLATPPHPYMPMQQPVMPPPMPPAMPTPIEAPRAPATSVPVMPPATN
jgi:hypothetical protein